MESYNKLDDAGMSVPYNDRYNFGRTEFGPYYSRGHFLGQGWIHVTSVN